MKTAGLSSLWLAFTVITITTASAQQPSLFNGNGIRSLQEPETAEKAKLHWPTLSDFTTDKETGEKRFSMFRRDVDSSSSENGDDTSLFGGFPSLLPKRDPDEPTMIQKMNEKSKDFVDRTSNWAQEKNQNFRKRTFDGWDSITKGLRPDTSSRFGTASDNMGAQPPLRTAEAPDNQPTARF